MRRVYESTTQRKNEKGKTEEKLDLGYKEWVREEECYFGDNIEKGIHDRKIRGLKCKRIEWEGESLGAGSVYKKTVLCELLVEVLFI